jgi:hypothetical protein
LRFKSSFSLFILTFFFLQTDLKSEEPFLHQYIEESPLVYARVPLSWQKNQIFSPLQNQKLTESILRATTKPGKLGYALRMVLSSMRDELEFMMIGRKEWPIPGLILRGKIEANGEKFAQGLMSVLRESLAIHQNRPNMDWIKFKKKEHKTKLIYKTYVLFWHVWIIVDKNEFTIMSTPNDPKFDRLLDKKLRDKSVLESDVQTLNDDLFVYCDFAQATKFYQAVMKDFAVDIYKFAMAFDLFNIDKLKIYSKGAGSDFSVNAKLSWDKKTRVWWQTFADQNKNSSIYSDTESDFSGFLKIPVLKQNEFNRLFYALSPKNAIKGPAYFRLYQSLGSHLNFSWSHLAVSPVFRLELKNQKSFNKELINILKLYTKISVEKEGKKEYTHIVWGENTVSYYVEGNVLYFSPLLHGLKDKKQTYTKVNKSEFSLINYPSKGNITNAYYAMIHLILQAFIVSKKGVDPNDFPAFSQTNLVNKNWSKTSSLAIDIQSETMTVSWKQPYGLAGLLAGSNIPSSAYISFFTLLLLTVNSF